MKVLFILNFPSPYRVDFLNELGRSMDVTAAFDPDETRTTDRPASWGEWFDDHYERFNAVFLKTPRDIVPLLKNGGFDAVVVGGYTQKTAMLAIEWLRLHRRPFWMEADGGIIKQDNFVKYHVKRHFISAASAWLGTGAKTTDYFVHYGAKRARVYTYPFSTLHRRDILPIPPTAAEKAAAREKLGLHGAHVTLGVGQFIPRKGFDLLLRAWASCPAEETLCIVGQEPPQEYLDLKAELHLDNVQFVGFRKKDALQDYYRAADLFVLPTREDIWGLVVNEAMANALPVITTDRCVAGLELVQNDVNGYIVPVEDVPALAEKINAVLADDALRAAMAQAGLAAIAPYTIENMAAAHCEILTQHAPGMER